MYKFKTSEQNNEKATEFETKSLLYLLTKIKGHSKVDLFIIDCFNDVTGASEHYTDSWDVQSKNVASLTPRTVGKALYTLFANFVSDISFGHYILYLPQLKEAYINDIALESCDISNFKSTKVSAIKEGLIQEIERRNDPEIINTKYSKDVDEFLPKVIFVFDHYGKSDYIKSIIEFKNLNRLDESFLVRIFDEIRTQQASKKIKCVFGEEVTSIQEAEKFGKNISRKDIELLVINRVIGNDLFSSKGIPLYFVSELAGMDEEDIADLIQDCQAQISRTLFNKHNKKAFWLLLEEIIVSIEKNRRRKIRDILTSLNKNTTSQLFTMNQSAILYLIALIKEGLENENS